MTHPIILADAERIASRVDLSPLKGKSVLVTGATGLIGTTLCEVLRTVGVFVMTQSRHDATACIRNGADYVVHAAGYSAPSAFLSEPVDTVMAATWQLDYTLKQFLKPGGTFLFLSSSEVYSGATPPHREQDIGTTTPEHPRAAYIEGKRCGEAICHAYRAQGVDAKIARVSLAYGPGTKKGDTRVLNQFIEQALTKGRITMRDSGGALRAYCYVADTVTMLLNVLLHGKQAVYNVGNPYVVSINELAEEIGRLTKVAVDWPNVEPDTAAPAAVRLDINRYIAEFGAPEFVSLAPGLRATIEYQRSLYA